jgi:hypothetical protein
MFPPQFDVEEYNGWFQDQLYIAKSRFGPGIVVAGSAVIRAECPTQLSWMPDDFDVFLPYEGTEAGAVMHLLSLSGPEFRLAKITLLTPWPTGDLGAEDFNKRIIATGTFTRADDVPMQLVLYRGDLYSMVDIKVLYVNGIIRGEDLASVRAGILPNLCKERKAKYLKRGFKI